jgi:hypothetical protein
MSSTRQQAGFRKGFSEFTKYGRWLFSTLAWQVSRYPQHFQMELEGHTEAGRVARSEITPVGN